jgi:DNA-binding MarR family transcriptional regulator
MLLPEHPPQIARRYDEALKPLDLTNGQFSALVTIAGMRPIAMQALADHLGMDRTTATAMLKPMTRRGLVVARASSEDRRSRLLDLSDRGLALLREAMPLWRRAQQAVARELGATTAGATLRQLSRLS